MRYGLQNAKPRASVRPCPQGHGPVRETEVITYEQSGQYTVRYPGSQIMPIHGQVNPLECPLREADSFSSKEGYRSTIVVQLYSLHLSDHRRQFMRFCERNNIQFAEVVSQRNLFTVWGDNAQLKISDLYGHVSVEYITEVQKGLQGAGDVRHVARKPGKTRSKPAKRKPVSNFAYADQARRNTAKYIHRAPIFRQERDSFIR